VSSSTDIGPERYDDKRISQGRMVCCSVSLQILNNTEKTDKSDGTVLNLSAQECVITAAHLPSVFTYVSLDIYLLTDEGLVTIELAEFVGLPNAGVGWSSSAFDPTCS
jgi:hypothetical protein